MINESEMKTKKEKNEKWKFVCKPNMTLHLKWERRPKVVLECSFEHKPYLREESERRSKGLQEEVILV